MQELWRAIVDLRRSNRWMIWFFGGLGLFVAGIIVGTGAANAQPNWFTYFVENFWVELVGILMTVFVIDRYYEISNLKERKTRLFNQLKSRASIIAIDALEQLRHEGWLGQALQYHTDLKGEQANLRVVAWQGAYLNAITLNNVDMRSSKFNGADLRNADLRGCDLAFCDLTDVFIGNTDLRGADLFGADLSAIRIANKETLGPTKLPDGTLLSHYIDTKIKFEPIY